MCMDFGRSRGVSSVTSSPIPHRPLAKGASARLPRKARYGLLGPIIIGVYEGLFWSHREPTPFRTWLLRGIVYG